MKAAARASVFLEDAEIVDRRLYPGDQHVLRVHAPKAAQRARAGSFAHVCCDAAIPLRRPLSIMRSGRDEGWLEFLYRPVGPGLAMLAEKKEGERVSTLAPIGRSFALDPSRPRLLAIGGGVGIPPMIFLADEARRRRGMSPFVLMGSEVPFPFELRASQIAVRGVSDEAWNAVSLLEEWGVPSRLASNASLPGCHRGYVTALAQSWLEALPPDALAETQVFGCGPVPMLRATAALAREFDLPCQLSVEEYMACGVGGCAGCTVLVQTPAGPAMKRVCVDGPVFDAREVFPQ